METIQKIEKCGGGTWKKLDFTTSNAIQNNLLKVAKEVCISMKSFGSQIRILPTDKYTNNSSWLDNKHGYIGSLIYFHYDTSFYFAKAYYVWDRDNGYIYTILLYADSIWTDTSIFNPQQIDILL